MALITYTKGIEDNVLPKHIICVDKKGQKVATVMCDTCVYFEKVELTLADISQITTIANNFNLFYDNIK